MSIAETFDVVARQLVGINSFSSARKVSRESFTAAFLNSSESQKISFSSELFRWSQNKLHSRQNGDRLAALVGFAFFVDIDDDQKQLLALAQSLERILPLEVVCLVDGIAHLIKRIAKRVDGSIVSKLFQRCVSWLATRATKSAVLSSVFIILRLASFDSSLLQRFASDLHTVINTALMFDSEEIQKSAVELAMKKIACDPMANEYISTYITSTTYLLQSDVPVAQIIGMLKLLTSFVEHNRDVCRNRAGDLFPSITQFLREHPNEEYLSFLAHICEKMPLEAKEFSDSISSVFRTSMMDFKNPNICRIFSRIAKAMPELFSRYASELTFSLFPSMPVCFFIIAEALITVKPEMVDKSFIIGAFQSSPLSEEFVSASVAFARAYPSDVFKMIGICMPKLKEDSIIKLRFLDMFSFVDQLPLLDYWDSAYDAFCESDEKTKIAAIPALLAIINRESEEEQQQKLFSLLFSVQSDESAEVKIKLLNGIGDSLMEIITDPTIFFIIEQLYEDEEYRVRVAALRLISRLREFSALSTYNFFHSRLGRLSEIFFQIASKKERVDFIKIVPEFITSSGDFVSSHGRVITRLLLEILACKPATSLSISNMVNERRDMVYDRKIRILALKAIGALSTRYVEIEDMVGEIVDVIVNQLTGYRNTKIHLAVLQTLRCLFRRFPIVKILPTDRLVQLHQNLFQFIKTSSNSEVNIAMMKLLSTIGSLDPHEFHAMKAPGKSKISNLLCDKSKREQTYLAFVMKYILGQLRDGGKTHDTSVLITAIVYIFQSDVSKCLLYLRDVVEIFISMLNREHPVVTPDELFHFFRSILLVVDVHIFPYANDIYQMLLPYLQPPKPNVMALKLLSALIYAMKASFLPYGSSTFSLIVKLIQEQDRKDFDTVVFLLLTLTLITIFADGASTVFFEIIQEFTVSGNPYAEFALTFLCQVMRCCNFTHLILPSLKIGLKLVQDGEPRMRENAIQLLYLLILRFHKLILTLPMAIKGVDQRLDDLMAKVETYQYTQAAADFLQHHEAVPDPFPVRGKPTIVASPLSQIFGRFRHQPSVSENDWSAWLLQLSQELVLCSDSPAIRASHPLLRVSTDFERNLFPLIVVSVWDIAKPEDRELLSNYLLTVIHNSQTPPDILQVIVSACDAMDRANFSLFKDPFIAGQVAERCNSWFQALRFFEKALTDKNKEPVPHLLRIHSLLKRKESALGFLTMADSKESCDLLKSLSMWSQARDIYAERITEDPRNETNMTEFLRCSILLEDWDAIQSMAANFNTFSKDMQSNVAIYFAAAASQTKCGDAAVYLNAIRTDEPITCMWRSIVALSGNDIDTAIQWADRGRALQCRDMSGFASGYEPAFPAICVSIILEEICDVANQRRGILRQEDVLRIWNNKADYISRDGTQVRNLYRVRRMLNLDEEEDLKIRLKYVDSLRRSKEWVLFDNCFHQLLEHSTDDRVNILRAKFQYDRGMTKDLSEFEEIIHRLKTGPVFCDAVCAYCTRSPIDKQVIPYLRDVINLQPTRVRAWKHWAYFNLGCIQDGSMYASNALIGFATLIKLTDRPSLHYLCQLCSLFFTFGTRLDNFASAAESLKSLSPSSVIQIIPQLMAQFDHESAEVRLTVFDIVAKFAKDHFQALAMPLCLVKRTPTSSEALLTFIEKVGREHHQLMHDAEEFTEEMLKIAVTAVEEIIAILEKLVTLADYYGHEEEVDALFSNIVNIVNGRKHESFIANIFGESKMRGFISRVEASLKKDPKNNGGEKIQLVNTACITKSYLMQKMDSISTLDISEMGIKLCNTDPLSTAIPGFYAVDESPATIQDIGRVMKLIPSAKRPRKLRILGSDGRSYKYLLKGREDLRLDQRVMQLFSLTNSILHDDKFGVEKHLHIRQVPIVPLAPNAGLIAWAEGGETLYSMISWHRKVVGIDHGAEKWLLRRYVGDDSAYAEKDLTLKLSAIQKLELHRELCALAPDDDIRETLWLRSKNAEHWLGRTTNFARSNGLMSVIGYIMGIGDRHPSNILVMKETGNVVHIDFSDCFEKASLRQYVHETVPFRLTRMLVKGLGASGINGVFTMTAEYVLGLMRRNKETLMAFLDIFVQDPITDTIWYKNAYDIFPPTAEQSEEQKEEKTGSTLKRAIVRVNDKLNGKEFEGASLNVSDQVAKLIELATDDRNLSQMYYGWAPYW